MDDTQQSRASDAAATRKRRSSILKSQRPARTPFSELEFNVATPTDTAKSRRVSFSRRTGVAEFVTHDATTTWKNFYEEHNKSLESSSNDSEANASRQPVGHLGKRIFDQQFEEVEAVDFISTLKPTTSANGSINNVNFTQQIASFECTIDGKLAAPQNNFELSALTDQHSKVFGNDFTIPNIGETSGRIDVNFSAIQQVGEKDDLDEIQRDIARVSNNKGCNGGPFNDRQNMSEYIEVDLNITHGALRNEEDMSITDTVHSPVQDISKSSSIDKKVSLNRDWVTDKENIVVNPYAAPRESVNFAINDEPEQVLVFDGKRLTLQPDKPEKDKNYRQTLLPNSSAETPQRKTIVLNVNDDLPNFAEDTLNSKSENHCISGIHDLKPDYISEDEVPTMLPVNRVDIVPKKKSIHECTGNISITQALPTNIITGKADRVKESADKRRTKLFDESASNISLTQTIPVKLISHNKQPERRRTVVYEDDTGNISITQAVPTNILVNESFEKKEKRKTIVFDEDKGNISVTQALSSNIIIDDKIAEKRKTIVFNDEQGNVSITQALSSNILDDKVEEKRKTIVFDNDDGNVSITQAMPTNIVLSDRQLQEKRRTIIYEDDSGNISVTQGLPSNVIIPRNSDTSQRRHTVVYEDETGDISVTQAVPSNILQEISSVYGVKLKNTESAIFPSTQSLPTNIMLNDCNSRRRTIVYGDDTGDVSITEAVSNRLIAGVSENSSLKSTGVDVPKELSESSRRKHKQRTIVYDYDNDVSITEVVRADIDIVVSNEATNKRKTILFENDDADISMTQAIPTNVFLLEKLDSAVDQSIKMQQAIEEVNENVIDYEKYEPMPVGPPPVGPPLVEPPIPTIEDLQEKRKTVVVHADDGDVEMSITEAIPKVQNFIQETEKRKTLFFDIDNGNLSMTKPIPADLLAYQNDILNKSRNKQFDFTGQEMLANPCPNVIVYQASTRESVPKLQSNRTDQGDSKSERLLHKDTNSEAKEMSTSKVIDTVEGSVQDELVGSEDVSLVHPRLAEKSEKWNLKPNSSVAMDVDVNVANVTETDKETVETKESQIVEKPIDAVMNNNIPQINKQTEEPLLNAIEEPQIVETPKDSILNTTEPQIVESPKDSALNTIHVCQAVEQPKDSILITSQSMDKPKDSILNTSQSVEQLKDSILITSQSMDKPKDSILNTSQSVEQSKDTILNTFRSMDEPKDSILNTSQSVEQSKDTILNTSRSIDEPKDTILNKSRAIDEPKDSILNTSQSIDEPKDPILNTSQSVETSKDAIMNTSQSTVKTKESILNALLDMSHSSMGSGTADKNIMVQMESNHSSAAKDTEAGSIESMFYITKDSDDEAQIDRKSNKGKKKSNKSFEIPPIIAASPLSMELEDESPLLGLGLQKKLDELKTAVSGDHNTSINRFYEKIVSANLEDVVEKDENVRLREQSLTFKRANDTKELLEMISDFTDNKEDDESDSMFFKVKGQSATASKSEISEPKRLSFASNRQSIAMTREDFLTNISMAQAALQKSRINLDDTDTEDDTRDGSIDQSFSKKSRTSNEVVKTLHFDDESMSEYSVKSDKKMSPLKKTAFGETSYMTEVAKAKVIPTYLKDVSDGMKELMLDLVKPMADNMPFESTGIDKGVRKVPSTQSMQIQANLISSSQVEMNAEYSNSASRSDIDKVHFLTGGVLNHSRSRSFKNAVKFSTNSSSEKSSEFEVPSSHQRYIYSRVPIQQPATDKVIVFDHLNPLNNILLGSIDYANAHKYNPKRSDETLCGSERSHTGLLHSDRNNDKEYEMENMTAQYRMETRVTNANKTETHPYKHEDQDSLLSNTSKPISIDQSIDVKGSDLKDNEANTLIAMKGNKELLEASSSLTLVDDALVQQRSSEEEGDTKTTTKQKEKKKQKDTKDEESSSHHKIKVSRSPVKIIYKIEEQGTAIEKENKPETAPQEKKEEEIVKEKKSNKAKKRIHSSTTVNPTLPPVDVTPKPVTKMQKIANSPNLSRGMLNIVAADELMKLAAEKDVAEIIEHVKQRDLKDKKKSPRKSKEKKPGSNVTVQQLTTDYHMDAVNPNIIDSQVLDALNPKSDSSTAPASQSDVLESNSLEVVSSFTSSKNLNAMKEVQSMSTTHSQQSSGLGKPVRVDWHPELVSVVSSSLTESESAVNVVAKIDMLPFMGSHECEWENSSADTWSFRLLHGRLRLSARLEHRHDNATRTRVRGDTPVLDIAVETVQHDKKNPVATLCVRFACETMRYMVSRACRGSCFARDIPPLLRRCAAVARVALRWGRAMHDAKLHLAYSLDNNGYLTLKVANIPLRSVWEVSMRVELVVDDAREAPWPRAGHVRVTRVVSDVNVPDDDVRRALAHTPRDWGHAPRTIWRMFRYLKHKTRDDDVLL